MDGMITEIQRGSLHDGPGIRTVVFLKGCNLRCAWCHNPETIYPDEETLVSPDKCIGCGRCEQGCFSGARTKCGSRMTSEEILQVILEDRPYYGPDGGVTISGGEPVLQSDFAVELLEGCRRHHIHTAIETNLSLPEPLVRKVCGLCGLIMCDLKAMDEGLHRKFTGAGNRQILSNLKSVSQLGIPMLVRTPVVSGINDSLEEISAIAEFLSSLSNVQYYELLTYHPLGLSKPVSEHFQPQAFEKPSKEKMRALAAAAASFHIPVRIDNVVFQEAST